MEKAVVYCRCNYQIDDHDHCQNIIDAQFFRIAAYADAHRIIIVDYFEDKGMNNKFAGFINLLAEIKKKQIKLVLTTNYELLPDNTPIKTDTYRIIPIDSYQYLR